MKKLITGAIAGTVGIALLAGGAGTFALWSTSANVSAATITAGHLKLTAGTDGAWTEGATAIPSIDNYRIVPNKTITYTQTLTIDAQGNGLTASMAPELPAAAAGTLASNLTISSTITELTDPSNVVTVSGNNVSVAGTGVATVRATVTVKFNDVTGTTGMDQTANLAALKFVLTQN